MFCVILVNTNHAMQNKEDIDYWMNSCIELATPTLAAVLCDAAL